MPAPEPVSTNLRGYAVRAAAALAAGLALWLSFPNYNLWWLAPVGVALLGGAVLDVGARRGLVLGLIAGLAYFVPTLSWSGVYVGKFPWFALTTFEALYVAVMGAAVGRITASLRSRDKTGSVALRYAAIPLGWVAQELARGSVPFGGFPWARLAFSQADSPLANYAQFAGAPGLSFVVAVAGTLLLAAASAARSRRVPVAAAYITAVAVIAAGGALAKPRVDGREVTVALVQGNVPKAGLDFNSERRAVLDNHARGSELVAEQAPDDLSVVLWPENSSDIDPLRNGDATKQVQRALSANGVPLLIGTVLREPDPYVSNTSLLYRPEGGEPERYVKNRPVPFAEYIPYRSFFRFFSKKVDLVTTDFKAGTELAAFQIDTPDGPYAVVPSICFEVAVDPVVRESLRKARNVTPTGESLLVVQTNNATFGFTAEAEQQFAISRIRAIEHGQSVAHVSTVGVSGLIAPDGSVTGKTGLFTAEQVIGKVAVRGEPTLAARVGPWPEWLATGVFVVMLLVTIGPRSTRVGRP